jgi:enoyl-CoA hydratase/carnithine racemase
MSRKLADYKNKYANVALEREDGILLVRLHSGDGPLVWEESAHRELPDAFYDIGADQENLVVILTGTGDTFSGAVAFESWTSELRQPIGRDRLFREGKQLVRNLLDINVPVIGVVNGPARIHAEIPLLSDVVLASETAVFQDGVHFAGGGVPGDGVHTLWQQWLGPNRGRAFLLQNQEISARDALSLGLVAEVCSPDTLLDRAWDVARRFAARPIFTLRYTRLVLTMSLKRAINAELDEGHALELLGRAFGELQYPGEKYPYIKDGSLYER